MLEFSPYMAENCKKKLDFIGAVKNSLFVREAELFEYSNSSASCIYAF